MSSVYVLPAPEDAPPAPLYLCTNVDHPIADRCTLLRGLANTDGPTQLPVGILLHEYRTWTKLDPENIAYDVPVDDLCTALRVADVLGDSMLRKFAEALAEPLQSTNWSSADESDAMMYMIHSLNSNLQREVLGVGWHGILVPAYLDAAAWPISLQQARIDACVSANDSIVFDSIWDEEADAKGLTKDAAYTRLLYLVSRSRKTCPGLSKMNILEPLPSMKAACLLSEAIAHHSTISGLHMWHVDPPPRPDPDATSTSRDIHRRLLVDPHACVATAISTVPQLSALTNLSIQILHHLSPDPFCTAALISALAQAIRTPQHLASVEVSIGSYCSSSRTSPLDPKKQGDAAPTAHVSLSPLLRAFAAAPSLTSLAFKAHPDLPTGTLPRSFPKLRSLELSPSTIHPFSQIPVHSCSDPSPDSTPPHQQPPALSPALKGVYLPTYEAKISPVQLSSLLKTIHPCTTLERLSLGNITADSDASITEAATKFTCLCQLTALSYLEISISYVRTEPRTLPLLLHTIAQLPHLHVLHFSAQFEGRPRHSAPGDWMVSLEHAYNQLLLPQPHHATADAAAWHAAGFPDNLEIGPVFLSRLTCLTRLHVWCDVGGTYSSTAANRTGKVSRGFVNLTESLPSEHPLTLSLAKLSLCPSQRMSLPTRMPCMHALQSLTLGQVKVRSNELLRLAEKLPALSAIVLAPKPLDATFVRALAAAAGMLPSLAQVRVNKHAGANEMAQGPGSARQRARRMLGYIDALHELPRRGRYSFPNMQMFIKDLKSAQVKRECEAKVAAVATALQGQGARLWRGRVDNFDYHCQHAV